MPQKSSSTPGRQNKPQDNAAEEAVIDETVGGDSGGISCSQRRQGEEQAQQPGIELIKLVAYSPDLNPNEGLWKRMRAVATQHICHASLRELFLDCKALLDRNNQDPQAMIDRLWSRFEVDPNYAKQLLSHERELNVLCAGVSTVQPETETQARGRKLMVEAGVPLDVVLRREGWSEEEIVEIGRGVLNRERPQ